MRIYSMMESLCEETNWHDDYGELSKRIAKVIAK